MHSAVINKPHNFIWIRLWGFWNPGKQPKFSPYGRSPIEVHSEPCLILWRCYNPPFPHPRKTTNTCIAWRTTNCVPVPACKSSSLDLIHCEPNCLYWSRQRTHLIVLVKVPNDQKQRLSNHHFRILLQIFSGLQIFANKESSSGTCKGRADGVFRFFIKVSDISHNF